MNSAIKKILYFFNFLCVALIFIILILLWINPVLTVKKKAVGSPLYLYVDNSASMYQHRQKIGQFYNELKKIATNIVIITFAERTQWHTNLKEIDFNGQKSSSAVLNSLLSPTTPAVVVSDFIFSEQNYPLFKNIFYLDIDDYDIQSPFQPIAQNSNSVDIGIQIIDSTIQILNKRLSFYSQILANKTLANTSTEPSQPTISLQVSLFQEKKSKIWQTNVPLANNKLESLESLEVLIEIPLTEFLDQQNKASFNFAQPFLIQIQAKPLKNETEFKNNADRHIYRPAEKQLEIIFCAFAIDPEITKIKNVFRNYQKFNLQSKYFLTPQAQKKSAATLATFSKSTFSKEQNKIYLVYGNPPASFLNTLKKAEWLTLHLPQIKTKAEIHSNQQIDFYRYLDYNLPFWSLKQDQAKAQKMWQAIAPFFKTAYQVGVAHSDADWQISNHNALTLSLSLNQEPEQIVWLQQEKDPASKQIKSLMYRWKNYFYLGLNGFAAFESYQKEQQHFERFWYLLLEYLNQNQYNLQKYYEYFLGDSITLPPKTATETLPHLLPLLSGKDQHSPSQTSDTSHTHYLEPLLKNSGWQKRTRQNIWLNYRIPVAEFLPTASSVLLKSNNTFNLKKIKQNSSSSSPKFAQDYFRLRNWKWIYLILLLTFSVELIVVLPKETF